MNRMVAGAIAGAVGGAAGTFALDAVTYGDMLVRGRPSSQVPDKVAGELADRAGISLGDPQKAGNRRTALGALLGYATGALVGAVFGVLEEEAEPSPLAMAPVVGITAMLASDSSSVALGATDPRSWGVSGWLTDLVAHLVYGAVTVVVFQLLTRGSVADHGDIELPAR